MSTHPREDPGGTRPSRTQPGGGRPAVWPTVAVLGAILVVLGADTAYTAATAGPVPWSRWATLAVIAVIGIVFVSQRRR